MPDERQKPTMRPVGRSAEEILAQTERDVQQAIDDVMPDLRENWKHLSPGTRHALLEGFAQAPAASDEDPNGG